MRDGRAVQQDGALVGVVDARKAVQKGRFTCAVRAKQREHFAFADVEAYVLERGLVVFVGERD